MKKLSLASSQYVLYINNLFVRGREGRIVPQRGPATSNSTKLIPSCWQLDNNNTIQFE